MKFLPVIALASAVSAFLHPMANLQKLQLLAEMENSAPPVTYKPFTIKGIAPAVNGTNATAAVLGPVYAEKYTVPLDHFGGDNGSFEVRYWVQESDYKEGGPVFVYDVGEGDAEAGSKYRLQNETSFFKQLVKEFHGIGIVLEHRYYGKSLPFNISVNTPAKEMQYLSAEQALADFPILAHNFTRANFSGIDLTPKSTPWIFVGGSYSGMRAAFMRKTYPDSVFASYASSSPVQARIDMSVYFEQVYRGLVSYGFHNCSADVHAAVEEIDRQLNVSQESADALKIKFLGPTAEENSNEGFGDALSVVFFAFQSYGMEGSPASLREFCDYISTDPKTGKTSPAGGWAARRGAQYVVDRWASWKGFSYLVNYYSPTNCLGPETIPKKTMFLPNGTVIGPPGITLNITKNENNTVSCRLDDRSTDPGTISWAWQYCSQFGYYQTQNKGPQSIVTSMNTIERQTALCRRQFPDGISSGYLPQAPQVDAANQRFGGWDIQVSNVFWTGGEFDPWRTLSPFSDEEFAPDFRIHQNIPKCGAFPEKHTFFGYLMKDAQHCYDFRTTFPPGQTARGYFTQALHRWIGCFRQDRKRTRRSTAVWSPPAINGPKLSGAYKLLRPIERLEAAGPARAVARSVGGRYAHIIETA